MVGITKDELAAKIKASETVLVVTQRSPSVSQIAAGMGLTSMLKEMDKDAVFVHDELVPTELDYLNPSDSISQDAESFCDFIISFDAAKAGKLRHSQDDGRCSISITPYRGELISERDLRFEKGDFNIDLIIAIGVEYKDKLCRAVGRQKQLMAGAGLTMVNLLTSEQESQLEADFWRSTTVNSGWGEMIYELGERLGGDRMKRSSADALLASIADYTSYFTNSYTQAETMHVVADLISYGANIQKVAEHLSPKKRTLQKAESIATSSVTPKKVESVEEVLQTEREPSEEAKVVPTVAPAAAMSNILRHGDLSAGAVKIGKGNVVNPAKNISEKHAPGTINIDGEGNMIPTMAQSEEKADSNVATAMSARSEIPSSEQAGVNSSQVASAVATIMPPEEAGASSQEAETAGASTAGPVESAGVGSAAHIVAPPPQASASVYPPSSGSSIQGAIASQAEPNVAVASVAPPTPPAPSISQVVDQTATTDTLADSLSSPLVANLAPSAALHSGGAPSVSDYYAQQQQATEGLSAPPLAQAQASPTPAAIQATDKASDESHSGALQSAPPLASMT